MLISTGLLRQRVDAIGPLDGIDVAALTGDQAARWVSSVAEIRHATDAIMALLAQHIDALSAPEAGAARFARARGFSGAAGFLSDVGEISTADASKLISLGKALAETSVEGLAGVGGPASGYEVSPGGPGSAQATPPVRFPHLARAIELGWLGTEKATIIRRTLEDMTTCSAELEESMVTRARRFGISEVRKMCQIELARSDNAALQEREKRNRAARYLTFVNEPDGMTGIHGKLDAADAAYVRTWFDTQVRSQLNVQRDDVDGEKREPGQIAADVLTALARHALGCDEQALGVKTTVVVRVAKTDLESGLGLADCDGIETPISVATLRRMAVDAEVLPAVLGGDSIPLDFGHAERLFTKDQKLAVAERDGGCVRCGAPVARCDTHHIQWWCFGGATDLRNAVLLCVGCHHRLHDYGWDVEVDPDGSVWIIPPPEVDPLQRRQRGRSARLAT